MVKLYTEKDLGALVAGEWELVGGLGARVDSGVGVTATLRELPGLVWKHTHDIALPFPFTLKQFRAFCAWHPTFEWEAIQSQFTNDDGSLDEAALNELVERGTDATELVRRFLAGESDEAPAERQTAQQDAPRGNKSGASVAQATPMPVIELLPQETEKSRVPKLVEAERQSNAPIFSMPRAALIAAHEHEWPTIRGDISEAHSNGLDAAKAGQRGWWEARALDWARAKGRLKPEDLLAQAVRSMSGVPGRRHKLEG